MAQFPNAGFDSPEVREQIAATFEQVRAAFAAFAEACKEVWQEIVKIFTPLVDWVIEQGRAIARDFPYLIPRQYRNTIMRKKIRRYARERKKG